ncbi:lasso peptide biosynthesis B2 protein [Candidatus Dependentiae bacterium]|nr:lasso peptide biosynthesis B2 protein [Candidatus Dependentiae bacterium]
MKKSSKLFKIKIIIWIILNILFVKLLKRKINIKKLAGIYVPKIFIKKNVPPCWYDKWVTRFSKILSSNPNCLEKSLLLYHLLNKYVAPEFEFHIGISNQTKLEGHSWIKCNNKKLFDTVNDKSKNYSTIISFFPKET